MVVWTEVLYDVVVFLIRLQGNIKLRTVLISFQQMYSH